MVTAAGQAEETHAPSSRKDACRGFRVHLSAEAPQPPVDLASNEVKCITWFEALDHDRDGIKDWTATYDGQTSSVLFPLDDDMDGDGIVNVLDEAPLDARRPSKSARNSLAAKNVPRHLVLGGKAGRLQAELFRRFNVLAVDHTDRHAPGALAALLTLYEKALPETTRAELNSVRYVYAFAGHDRVLNIAAYHRQAKALSIGGLGAYGTHEKEFDAETKLSLFGSFAHEIGHAFLFDRMSAEELREVGTRFGNWAEPETTDSTKTNVPINLSGFLDHRFFRSHPLRELARTTRKNPKDLEFINRGIWRESNLVSEYATTNIHEWFADAFAAALMQKLGEQGELGTDWRERLARLPKQPGAYWVNYNNLTPSFRTWFDSRLAPARAPANDSGGKKSHGK
jgi:hypothetical protein